MKLALACVAALMTTSVQAAQHGSLTDQLRAKTQALADAVASGDTKTWLAATDPGLLFVSENNEVLTRNELIKQLEPLPKGLVGHITVTDFQVRRHGDVAVSTYIADEGLDYHGQPLRTKFRTTDAWHFAAGKWTMISSMTLAVLGDPPAIKLPAETLGDYVGRYELTPDVHYTVRRDGGRLMGLRDGGKEVELQAEARDLFFVAGSPRSRKVFYRDASGRVVGFGDRREGQDIKWKRMP